MLPDIDFDVECEPRQQGILPDIGADEVASGTDPGLVVESPSRLMTWVEDAGSILREGKSRLGSMLRGL